MAFNSFFFLIVYPIIFTMYYLIPSDKVRWRNTYLIVVSYLLYFLWSPVYVLVLFGITVASFFISLVIGSEKNVRSFTLGLWVLLILLPLFLFKYFGFISETLESFLQVFNVNFHLIGLNWAIPVGLSFYTLQALSYIFDVYHKKIEPEKDFSIYALYLSFFPTIMMGPITRASDMLPQFRSIRCDFDYDKVVAGLKYILWGTFLKVVVADRVGLYVDTVMDHYNVYSGATCFIGSVMYSVQIYADFAGYSCMAIGIGRMLGFDIKENFRRPFFAHSVSDYWTRWHLSLSSWLRDYIYIPLGGSREGKIKTYRNIFVTFMVSGIWHGANWTFILWGGWHAVCIMIERLLNQQRCNYKGLGRALKIIIAFLLVNFSRILFHSPTVTDSFEIMGKIFTFDSSGELFLPSLFTLIFVAAIILNDAVKEFLPSYKQLMSSSYPIIRWAAYVLLLIIILLEGVLDSGKFIYANF